MKTPIPSSETIIALTPERIVTIKGDAICTYDAEYYTVEEHTEEEVMA
ncbi:hypothetical protein LC040_19505 [Bacillus tianshenii]|nr:hypothetical protein LC040_19505 [Bacillus tianshenii]